MDLPDQSLGDRSTAAEPGGDELERVAVVQELAHVLGVRPGYGLASQKPLGFVQRELRSLDVGRVVRFENECTSAHLADPVLGESRGFQESARPLDAREIGGDPVGDGEVGLEGHRGVVSRTSILPVTAAEIRAVRNSQRRLTALRTSAISASSTFVSKLSD